MKVKLVTTPAVGSAVWTPPIGIAQLAGSLRANGIDATCVDFNPEYDYGNWISTEELAVEPKLKAAFEFIEKWGSIVEEWSITLLKGEANLIGISVLYHGMLIPSLALAITLHRSNPDVTIVMGGPFVRASNKALLKEMLENGTIAGILEGEGEEAILGIVKAVKAGQPLNSIPGMWVRDSYDVVKNVLACQVDPNKLPLADFSDFDLKKYEGSWHNSFPIFGSRGCINKCTFCNSYKHAAKFIQRDTDHILKEIIRDINEYSVSRIVFTDNLINGNPAKLKELCRGIIDLNLGIKFSGNLALLPSVDDEMLDLLKQAGFIDILLAVETPAKKVRTDMGKWPDVEGVVRIIRKTVANDLKPYLYLMHSFPTETDRDFDELLHFVDQFKPTDFMGMGFWPFRLAQVQPGEIDMNFVNKFNIKLLGGYGYDRHDARVAFGREPAWETEWVNDGVKKIRHSMLEEHIAMWKSGSLLFENRSPKNFMSRILSKFRGAA